MKFPAILMVMVLGAASMFAQAAAPDATAPAEGATATTPATDATASTDAAKPADHAACMHGKMDGQKMMDGKGMDSDMQGMHSGMHCKRMHSGMHCRRMHGMKGGCCCKGRGGKMAHKMGCCKHGRCAREKMEPEKKS